MANAPGGGQEISSSTPPPNLSEEKEKDSVPMLIPRPPNLKDQRVLYYFLNIIVYM